MVDLTPYHFVPDSTPYRFVLKTETDTINAKEIYTAVLLDISTGKAHRFANRKDRPPIRDAAEICDYADLIVSHTPFHRRTMALLYGALIPDARFIDTFALASKLFSQSTNGLSVWAKRLGLPARQELHGPNRSWSPALEDRCEADARIVAALYAKILKGPFG